MESGKVILNKGNFSGRNSRYGFLMEHHKSGKILDIGNVGGLYGGEGANFSPHLKFVSEVPESEVYGFDLYAPKEDADKYKNQKTGNLEEGLPYEAEFFDTVYLGEVIEHLHNPGMVLRDIHRILKPGGAFILDTPNAYNVRKLAKWLLQREENLGDPTHIIIFTPGSLVSLLEKNGFAIQTMSEKRTNWLSRVLGKGTGSHLLMHAKKA